MTTSLDFVPPRRSNQDQPSDWRRFLVAKPEVTSLTVREAAQLWLDFVHLDWLTVCAAVVKLGVEA